MALILNIDTATDSASICLAKDGEIILLLKNDHQKDHAAWLHVAIQKMSPTLLLMKPFMAIGNMWRPMILPSNKAH